MKLVLELLSRFADGKPRTADEMAQAVGVHRTQVINAISVLKCAGHNITAPGNRWSGNTYRIQK